MGYRIIERVFSDKEECPSILVANILASPNVESNLKKMEEIIGIAVRKKVNVVIFPELTVTGYVWDSKTSSEVLDLLAEGENNRISSTITNIRNSLTQSEGGGGICFLWKR